MGRIDRFRFKRHDHIGSADAEQDEEYLRECFVSTGDLDVLRNCRNSRSIVIGRTGSGKSALLIRLKETEERTIEVRPESLALAYISNSTILHFFSELGVKLDIFFKLLWRHVFTVEILKHHFGIKDEHTKRTFLEKLQNLFRDQKDRNAIEYLKSWGQSFWEETEYRIKEVTTTLENDLKASTKAAMGTLSFSTEAAQKLSEEQKHEIVQRAQTVVNKVQIRQLSDILDLVNDVLTDEQKRYFISIDRLDENWIEEKLRFRLIRALIETVKDFGKIKNAKIVVAIRQDLLDRVFRITRDAGFQEEKYASLYLPLQWTRQDLMNVLDYRINKLIQQRFTKEKVSYKDILPREIDRKPAIDHMIERTLMRPRDLIMFFNLCIIKASDRPQITVQMLRDAEGQYSKDRLRAIADEWVADYPNLIDSAFILRGRPPESACGSVTEVELGEFCLNLVTSEEREADPLLMSAKQYCNCEATPLEVRRAFFFIFYRVGIVGLKTQVSGAFQWAWAGSLSVTRQEITDESLFSIHPAFWRVFGIFKY
jgi:hypothetical protein